MRTAQQLAGLALAVALLCSIPALARAQTCAGDCNGDGTVTINELILGVNIALGSAMVATVRRWIATATAQSPSTSSSRR